jgi:hypothetical protein
MKTKKTRKEISRLDAAELLGCSAWLLRMKGPRPVRFEVARGGTKRAILDRDELMKWWTTSGTKERVAQKKESVAKKGVDPPPGK